MMDNQQRRRLTVSRADPAGRSGGGTLGNPLRKLLQDKKLGVDVIHSVTDSELKKKRSFAEKDRIAMESDVFCDGTGVPAMKGVYYTCRKGLKPESPNQDSYVIVIKPGKWGLYGVFDGHGPNGHDVSDFAVKTLVMNFLETDNFEKDGTTGEAFTRAFQNCQAMIEDQPKGDLDSSSSGSTCTMAFHNFETDILTLAHVGDSRGVLYTGNELIKPKSWETEDHKPNLPGEKARIEKMGGRVVFDGYYNYRVFAKAGMYPGLNMSRALGDVVAHKEAGLTAEPELNIIKLKELRKESTPLTLIVASDGVWEFIESKSAIGYLCEGGKLCEGDKMKEKVEALAKKSWDSWMEDSDNEISDDISVVSITL